MDTHTSESRKFRGEKEKKKQAGKMNILKREVLRHLDYGYLWDCGASVNLFNIDYTHSNISPILFGIRSNSLFSLLDIVHIGGLSLPSWKILAQTQARIYRVPTTFLRRSIKQRP
jgi:hypothetical protein